MADPNFFDQFDEAPPPSWLSPTQPPSKANFFDQFDPTPKPGAYTEPLSGESWDSIASGDNPTGHILNAFGQGIKQGWGALPYHFSPEVEKFMRDSGTWKPEQDEHSSVMQTLNEAFMRPAAVALSTVAEAAYRGGTALLGGYQGAAEQAGVEIGQPALGRDIAALPEAFPVGHLTGFPALGPITEANALRVIGSGEAGWKGTIEATPEADRLAAQAEAVRALAPTGRPSATEMVPRAPEAPIAAPEPAAPLADVGTIARRLAPTTFDEYDALSTRRDGMQRMIDDLAEQRDEGTSPEIAAVDMRLRTARLAAAYNPRLRQTITDLESERAGLVEALPKTGDTPAMAALRTQMQEADYRMRDLAPQVSAAYRQAAEQGAPEATPETAPAAAPAEAPAAEAAPAPIAIPPTEQAAPAPSLTPAAAPAAAAPPIEGGIAGDVARQLATAGRPTEEADAAGALVAAHYEARAARFGGAKGTAEQLYNAEAPEVRAGRNARAVEYAQGEFGQSEETVRLYHGTNEEGAKGIQSDGEIRGPAFFTPRKDVAESYGSYGGGDAVVIPVDVPKAQLKIDFDLPGGQLLDIEQANEYAGNDDWTIDDYLKSGQSVGIESALPLRQKGELEQVRRGKIRLATDQAKATITLFKDADASTFIHETGHQWLEELMSDAADERAPADLTADAKTVRDWLGVEEGAEIPRKAHERFARGFERYMMEGRAPSQALASVFAKFKDWLTRIYQTVSALRSPINDDIRAVFDRMIATPEQPAAIVPEAERAAGAGMTHERLAETTAPEHAANVAEGVLADITGKVQSIPEVRDEISGVAGGAGAGREPGGGPGGEAGFGPAADQSADRDAAAARIAARDAGNAGGPGAIEPRGGAASAQGAALPEGQSAAAANQPFSRAESTLIDRAGNIRLDNLNLPEDVNAVLREVAEQNGDFLNARRGVLSDAEVLNLADALGMRPRDLDARKIGTAFNAEEVMAARKLLVQSAYATRDAAAKAADSGAEADILAYAEAKARHRMIQEQVSGVTAEAGRALRAFRAIEGSKEAEAIGQFLTEATEGRTLDQLRREARMLYQLDTPRQLSQFLAQNRTGLFDWIQSAFINALISNPATHGTYTVANQLLSWYKATAETAASAAVGTIRVALGASEADRVRFAEIPGQVFGLLNGYGNAARASWGAVQALKGRAELTLTGGSAAEKAASSAEVRQSLSAFGRVTPLPGEKLSAQMALKTGTIPNPEIGGVRIPIGAVIESPSHGVTALHAFSRTVGYSRSVSGQAYRIAANEGLEGNAFAARVADLIQNPSQAMMTEAIADANEDAMMQIAKFGSLTQKFSWLTNQGIPLPDIPLPGGRSFPLGTLRPIKFIDPFAVISSNIINATVGKRSVLGLLSEQMRADLSGVNGGIAADKAAGRLLAGTTMMLAFGGLAAESLLTGPRPADRAENARLRQGGWQPNAVKIGEHYFSLHGLGVVGMMASVASGMWAAAETAATGDMAKAGSVAIHAFAESLFDESPMRGVSELVQAITDPDRYGPSYIRQLLPDFVPFAMALGQGARIVDPYMREAHTITEAFQQHIPLVSEGLHPKIDVWGNPIPNRTQLVPGLLSIYETRINNDPVQQAYDRLGFFPAPIERKVRGVDLTEEQYETLARSAGRLARQRIEAIVARPGFAMMPAFVQREQLTNVMRAMREAARSKLMLEYPSILATATAEKKALVHGATPQAAREMLRNQLEPARAP